MEKIQYVDSKSFPDQVLSGKKAVLDFYSTECPPCEALAAKFESLSELYGDDIQFFKIFRQENRDLAQSLGVTSSPTLIFYQNGQEVGKRLSGAIKRLEITQQLENMLPTHRVQEIRTRIKKTYTDCDILILGGGPAGLAAAIYTAQAKVKTLLIDENLPGGQAKTTHLVSNYPGFIEPINGYLLMHQMNEQAKNAGVIFRSAADINSINLFTKEILIDNIETIKTRKIIIATGASPKPLGIKGEMEYRGQGISYCATCDAKFYEGKEVVIIGGGNTAIEESAFIAKFARKITIVHQFAHLQCNKMAQEKAFSNPKIQFIWKHEPREFIKLSDGTMKVVIENLDNHQYQTLRCDGIFVFAGMYPNLSFLNGELSRDSGGYILTDQDMRTTLSDVFAAGDVVSKRFRQITTSVADGTIAALVATRELEGDCVI